MKLGRSTRSRLSDRAAVAVGVVDWWGSATELLIRGPVPAVQFTELHM